MNLHLNFQSQYRTTAHKQAKRAMLTRIVISEFLERNSKAKHTRAKAYSRALRQIKGVVQSVVHGKITSDFERVRGDRVAVKGVVQIGRVDDRRQVTSKAKLISTIPQKQHSQQQSRMMETIHQLHLSTVFQSYLKCRLQQPTCPCVPARTCLWSRGHRLASSSVIEGVQDSWHQQSRESRHDSETDPVHNRTSWLHNAL